MFGRGTRVRPLRPAGIDGAMRCALQDPVINALPGARLAEVRGSLGALSQEFMTYGSETEPSSLLWSGVNVSPMQADERVLGAFAERLASQRRRAGSLVGPREDIERLWALLEPSWRPARALRWSQPLLEAVADPAGPEDDRVRPAAPGEGGLVFPASVAMFREEVGLDPTSADGGRGYRSRVDQLVAQGRTYLIQEGTGDETRVVFKADVGAVFGDVAQIHGVWVAPDLRGQGIARRAMAAVVRQARRDHVPRVSLYVNDFNEPARRAYAAAGFRPVGELATVMF